MGERWAMMVGPEVRDRARARVSRDARACSCLCYAFVCGLLYLVIAIMRCTTTMKRGHGLCVPSDFSLCDESTREHANNKQQTTVDVDLTNSQPPIDSRLVLLEHRRHQPTTLDSNDISPLLYLLLAIRKIRR